MKNIEELVKSKKTGDRYDDLVTAYHDREIYLNEMKWADRFESLFTKSMISDNTYVHYNDNNVYALSWFFQVDDFVLIHEMEVNPSMRNMGLGHVAMKEIAEKMIDMGYPRVKLHSLDEKTDNFYMSLGMQQKEREFTGDLDWLKSMVK